MLTELDCRSVVVWKGSRPRESIHTLLSLRLIAMGTGDHRTIYESAAYWERMRKNNQPVVITLCELTPDSWSVFRYITRLSHDPSRFLVTPCEPITGLIIACRLSPPSIDTFRRGGSQLCRRRVASSSHDRIPRFFIKGTLCFKYGYVMNCHHFDLITTIISTVAGC